jgi:Pyruvate/2-oxoacid:ferredoxin oxidoreductase delta subunit
MGLFKEVKKPLIRDSKAGGSVSSHRPAYVEKDAPCIAGCTVGNHVRDWMVPLAQHNAYGRTADEAFTLAWHAIVERNPFPAISGRVCQHPCEANCNRKSKDAPVAVQLLERFVGDFGISHRLKLTKPEITHGADRVAVVGAGPSGLSCAYRLVQLGYLVTLFDAAPLPGGMMRYRIPRQTISREILDAEIQNVLDLGIKYRNNCVVGQDVSEALLAGEYKGVFYAIGLQKSAQIQIRREGEGAYICGELPAEAPEPACETMELTSRILNTVTPAIAQGRRAAEDIDATLRGKSLEQRSAPTVIKADRMKLDWYPAAQRHEAIAVVESAQGGLCEEDAVAEAGRCMSCGLCMDCETCWMYCSSNCFVKLPKGEHYKIRLELCSGCGKCVEACPCGYISSN